MAKAFENKSTLSCTIIYCNDTTVLEKQTVISFYLFIFNYDQMRKTLTGILFVFTHFPSCQ